MPHQYLSSSPSDNPLELKTITSSTTFNRRSYFDQVKTISQEKFICNHTQETRYEMYDEQMTGFSAGTTSLSPDDCFSQMVHSDPALPPPENVSLSTENLAFGSEDASTTTTFTNRSASATSAFFIMEENSYGGSNNGNSHLAEVVNHHRDSNQLALSFDQSKWDTSDMQNHHQDQSLPYPTPDLLNLLYSLPSAGLISSFVDSSSISFENPTTQKTVSLQNPSGHSGLEQSTNVSSILQDPFLHLNLLPAHPPPALRELFQSLPHGYNILPAASKNDNFLLLGGEDDREGSGVVAYLDPDGIDFDNNNNNGVLKFTHDLASVGRKGGGRGGKRIKQVNTEKQRRVEFSSKFDALRELVPNPTKNDRASVVGDAIEYIQELLRSVKDLKLLVDKKRCGKGRIKRQKVEEDEDDEQEEEAPGDMESCNLKPLGESDHHLQPYNGCIIRSSWLQRKSKNTEVDVRIIDDEVTIKLVQRKKKINCLLYASKALDELELDVQHVAGGHIGDVCSFLFNSKIYEGSSVYASAIANKLIEVMDGCFQAA